MLDQDLSEEGFPNSQQGFSSEIELHRRLLWRKGATVEFSRLSGCCFAGGKSDTDASNNFFLLEMFVTNWPKRSDNDISDIYFQSHLRFQSKFYLAIAWQ